MRHLLCSDLDEEVKNSPAQGQQQSTSLFVKGEEEPIKDYAIRIFRRVFETDIASVLTMQVPHGTSLNPNNVSKQELWKRRQRPSPIVWPSRDEDLLSIDEPAANVYKVKCRSAVLCCSVFC